MDQDRWAEAMTELSVVFIWHMHQPYYWDMIDNRCTLPWVRLHSTMGYMDMAAAVSDSPGAKVTVNLTPSLVRQLAQYIEGGRKDDFQLLSEKPTAELTPEERAFILHYFFMANWDTMVRPYGGYMRLLGKRGQRSDQDFEQLQRHFSDAEIRDLVVWFNLTWLGWAALEMFPELTELKRKGRDFTEADKLFVLTCQQQIMREVLPSYGSLWDQGAVEISTSPMYHPILPLLWDTVLADHAHPGVKLPPRFAHPEDAVAQIQTGLAYMEEIFGKRPIGLWPSEGSVAPELVPAFLDAGLRWIATDEDILFKRTRTPRHEALFTPWKVQDNGRELSVFFRDHALSDLVGFTYAHQPPEQAAEDFVRRLREIRSSVARTGRDHAMVAVALDGENPWETYPDRGRGFLHQVYDRIMHTEGMTLATASSYLDEHPSNFKIDRLSTGSWINRNFDIWLGGPVENRAWQYLGQVRDDLPRLLEGASEATAEQALQSLYAAEGSDWFWWFGDQFHSELDPQFDYLFRMHLKNVYRALDAEPPLYLSDPVTFTHAVTVGEEPLDLIDPQIDGKVTDYYEWRAAGHIDLSLARGAMYISESHLKDLYYGFNLQNFFLRLDPVPGLEDSARLDVRIHLLAPIKAVVMFPFLNAIVARVFEENDNNQLILTADVRSLASDKVIEIAVPFATLGLHPGDEVQFVVELHEEQAEIERHPRDGFILFTVPDENFEARYWSV
jgi:alpha-amylase/alpha-mannosidase (GH57 family)